MCRRSGNGFTLVELLAVVAIFVVLLAILLPALKSARESARRVLCLSNLRQMAISAQIYANNNKDFFPMAYYYGRNGSTSYSYCWDLTVIYRVDQNPEVVPGLLWESQGVTAIQQCPSFTGAANWEDNPYTGYNYNTSYIAGWQDWGAETAVPSARANKIRSPAKMAMFGDGEYAGGANKFMRAPYPNPRDDTFSGRYAGTQGYRHQNLTNVGFVDGHAVSLSERFVDNSDGAENVALGTGFLSVDNHLYAGE